MNIDFSSTDIIFIYGTMIKQLKEIETVENSPSNPIDKNSLKNFKEPILSVTSKIEQAYPQILNMKNFNY